MSEQGDCPHCDSCEMYGLFKFEGTLSVWKINYCQGDFKRCERYQLSAKGESIPITLLPNGKTLSR